MKDISEKVLSYMKIDASKPLSIKELTKSIGVPRPEREGFKKALKSMVNDGTLVKIRGGRYGLPDKMNLLTGPLQCHSDGFGFVLSEDGGEDLFIRRGGLKGAMHGDTVVARVEGRKGDGKREGSIIRVLKRAHKTLVGTFIVERGFGRVVPSNERVLEDIIIPPGSEGGARDGMVVVARLTRWPARHVSPAGEVVEVLGSPEDPDVEIEVIVRKYDLPHRFPANVLSEARAVGREVTQPERDGRVDLRGRTIVTIDGESAKDFDDAVSIEKTARGYKLWVSIADVSHYVAEGTLLDTEAYTRGTSVYFPDRCVPMLPERLSNGICSLNPGLDRLTLTVELGFDQKGVMSTARFYESVIKSAARLTYTCVKETLEGKDTGLAPALTADLKLMEELALKLNRERGKQGSIDFDLPEPDIIIDIEGRVEDIARAERNIAHRIIEEFMLAANRAAAEKFSNAKAPFLYRVHESPDAKSVAEFREFAAGFGYTMKPAPKDPHALGVVFRDILAQAEGRPEQKVINHVLLRSMKRAEYSARNQGHFGLAFEDYTHFTSPIRRYPDLVVHRLLKKMMRKQYRAKERERVAAILPQVASHSSLRERTAVEAEREIVDLKKAQFMQDKVGERFGGFVSGVTSFGLFIELKEYFVEGLVHVTTLDDDYYIFDEKRHTLTGEGTKRRFSIGDEVEVEINRVDIERRRIDLVLGNLDGSRKKGYKRGYKRRRRR